MRRRARGVVAAGAACYALAGIPLSIAPARAQTPELADGADEADHADSAPRRQPYGLQRFEEAPDPAGDSASEALSLIAAALLGALASAALLLALRRLRSRPRRPADEAAVDEGSGSHATGRGVPARASDPAAAARDALGLALNELRRDPRSASNRAANALRSYGAHRWVVDLRALTTPEIERALGEADTPATSREFVRLLSRYDAERFQDERAGALARDAVRACVEASLRFVDDTAARPRS